MAGQQFIVAARIFYARFLYWKKTISYRYSCLTSLKQMFFCSNSRVVWFTQLETAGFFRWKAIAISSDVWLSEWWVVWLGKELPDEKPWNNKFLYLQFFPTKSTTVDGRNPAPPGMYKTPWRMGNLPYQLVQDFSHQQYFYIHPQQILSPGSFFLIQLAFCTVFCHLVFWKAVFFFETTSPKGHRGCDQTWYIDITS